jgi:hypothetical protein
VDDVVRARAAGEHGGAEVGAESWIVKGDIEGVICGGVVALEADVGANGFGSTKEDNGLVDEMRAEIEEDAGAGSGLFAPGSGAELGTEAVEVRLVGDDAAQLSGGDELLQGFEVAIPAAVLVDGEQAAFPRGQLGDLGGFGVGQGEGFVSAAVTYSVLYKTSTTNLP